MAALARERDEHKCQVCGSPERKKQKLDVDHIIPFRLVKRNDLENLISLCKSPCHGLKTLTAERLLLRGDFLGFQTILNQQGWPMPRVEAAISYWGRLA
jgi:5-methylcytosine-specific restriction endonuclease McrA